MADKCPPILPKDTDKLIQEAEERIKYDQNYHVKLREVKKDIIGAFQRILDDINDRIARGEEFNSLVQLPVASFACRPFGERDNDGFPRDLEEAPLPDCVDESLGTLIRVVLEAVWGNVSIVDPTLENQLRTAQRWSEERERHHAAKVKESLQHVKDLQKRYLKQLNHLKWELMRKEDVRKQVESESYHQTQHSQSVLEPRDTGIEFEPLDCDFFNISSLNPEQAALVREKVALREGQFAAERLQYQHKISDLLKELEKLQLVISESANTPVSRQPVKQLHSSLLAQIVLQPARSAELPPFSLAEMASVLYDLFQKVGLKSSKPEVWLTPLISLDAPAVKAEMLNLLKDDINTLIERAKQASGINTMSVEKESAQNKANMLQEKLDKSEKQAKDLQKQLDELKKSKNAVPAKDKLTSSQEKQSLSNEINTHKQTIARLEGKVNDLQQKLGAAEAGLILARRDTLADSETSDPSNNKSQTDAGSAKQLLDAKNTVAELAAKVKQGEEKLRRAEAALLASETRDRRSVTPDSSQMEQRLFNYRNELTKAKGTIAKLETQNNNLKKAKDQLAKVIEEKIGNDAVPKFNDVEIEGEESEPIIDANGLTMCNCGGWKREDDKQQQQPIYDENGNLVSNSVRGSQNTEKVLLQGGFLSPKDISGSNSGSGRLNTYSNQDSREISDSMRELVKVHSGLDEIRKFAEFNGGAIEAGLLSILQNMDSPSQEAIMKLCTLMSSKVKVVEGLDEDGIDTSCDLPQSAHGISSTSDQESSSINLAAFDFCEAEEVESGGRHVCVGFKPNMCDGSTQTFLTGKRRVIANLFGMNSDFTLSEDLGGTARHGGGAGSFNSSSHNKTSRKAGAYGQQPSNSDFPGSSTHGPSPRANHFRQNSNATMSDTNHIDMEELNGKNSSFRHNDGTIISNRTTGHNIFSEEAGNNRAIHNHIRSSSRNAESSHAGSRWKTGEGSVGVRIWARESSPPTSTTSKSRPASRNASLHGTGVMFLANGENDNMIDSTRLGKVRTSGGAEEEDDDSSEMGDLEGGEFIDDKELQRRAIKKKDAKDKRVFVASAEFDVIDFGSLGPLGNTADRQKAAEEDRAKRNKEELRKQMKLKASQQQHHHMSNAALQTNTVLSDNSASPGQVNGDANEQMGARPITSDTDGGGVFSGVDDDFCVVEDFDCMTGQMKKIRRRKADVIKERNKNRHPDRVSLDDGMITFVKQKVQAESPVPHVKKKEVKRILTKDEANLMEKSHKVLMAGGVDSFEAKSLLERIEYLLVRTHGNDENQTAAATEAVSTLMALLNSMGAQASSPGNYVGKVDGPKFARPEHESANHAANIGSETLMQRTGLLTPNEAILRVQALIDATSKYVGSKGNIIIAPDGTIESAIALIGKDAYKTLQNGALHYSDNTPMSPIKGKAISAHHRNQSAAAIPSKKFLIDLPVLGHKFDTGQFSHIVMASPDNIQINESAHESGRKKSLGGNNQSRTKMVSANEGDDKILTDLMIVAAKTPRADPLTEEVLNAVSFKLDSTENNLEADVSSTTTPASFKLKANAPSRFFGNDSQQNKSLNDKSDFIQSIGMNYTNNFKDFHPSTPSNINNHDDNSPVSQAQTQMFSPKLPVHPISHNQGLHHASRTDPNTNGNAINIQTASTNESQEFTSPSYHHTVSSQINLQTQRFNKNRDLSSSDSFHPLNRALTVSAPVNSIKSPTFVSTLTSSSSKQQLPPISNAPKPSMGTALHGNSINSSSGIIASVKATMAFQQQINSTALSVNYSTTRSVNMKQNQYEDAITHSVSGSKMVGSSVPKNILAGYKKQQLVKDSENGAPPEPQQPWLE